MYNVAFLNQHAYLDRANIEAQLCARTDIIQVSDSAITSANVSRRNFLKETSLSAGLIAYPQWANSLTFDSDAAAATASAPTVKTQSTQAELQAEFWNKPRELWLYRPNTRQNIREIYWADGVLNQEGYLKICQLMGDVHDRKSTYMDAGLLDILRAIQGYFQMWGHFKPIMITSGYRTERTNNSLIKEGAAKNSMHLKGKAVDLHMPGISLQNIAWLGSYFKKGGVGFYPSKGFVHLDTGSVRYWEGNSLKRTPKFR